LAAGCGKIRRVVRNTVLVLLAAIALLVVAIVWVPELTGGNQGAASSSAPAVLEPQPQTDHDPEPPPAQAPPAQPPQPVAAPAQTAPPANPAAVPPHLHPHPRSAQFAALLEARFQGDPVSAAAPLEADLRRKINAALPPRSRLESVECRKFLCRIRSTHPDMDTYQRYLQLFTNEDVPARVWLGQLWIAFPSEAQFARPADPVTSSVYLGRSDELPEP
jgi:hypothetical protein